MLTIISNIYYINIYGDKHEKFYVPMKIKRRDELCLQKKTLEIWRMI